MNSLSSYSCDVDRSTESFSNIFPFHCLDNRTFVETLTSRNVSNSNNIHKTEIKDFMSILETEGNNLNSCSYFTIDQFNKEYIAEEKNHSESFIHFNCRSLKKNFENLDLSLYLLKHAFKIIGLTKTWLTDTSPLNLYQLHDYVT